MKYRVFLGLVVVFMFSCESNKEVTDVPVAPKEEAVKPQNIILFIGDGTGLSQLSTLWYYYDDKPNYERFSTVGLSKTNSSSDKITDSGAGATAFSIGEKTYNGAIGVNKDSVSKETIFELLSKKGYNTGVISTSSITHATPASFYAHVKNRNDHEKIAQHLADSEIDFFAGGGTRYFTKRVDGQNLIEVMKAKGMAIDTNDIGTGLTGEKQGYLLAQNAMPTMKDGRGDFLAKATAKAVAHLSAEDRPFVLMVEGSQIDWGGHNNDGDYITTELKDFDQAIGVGLDFAEKNGHTTVVAIADHETGGFALSPTVKQGFGGVVTNDYDQLQYKFTTDGHTCTHIPVFAYGKGAELFSGIYENNTVYEKLLKAIEQTESVTIE